MSEKKYKIGEVCRTADVQPYVLRYWETEFPPLAPGKGGGGQRFYTDREVAIILRIKQLLYSEGFTIAGAKKRLEAELAQGEPGSAAPVEQPVAIAAAAQVQSQATEAPEAPRKGLTKRQAGVIERTRRELRELLDLLKE